MASPRCAPSAAAARRVARVHLRHADHSLRRHRHEHRDLQSRTRSPPAAVALSGFRADRPSGTGLGRTAEGSADPRRSGRGGRTGQPSRSGGESLARSSRLLRATPQLGRVFTDADAVDGAHRIVLLIHSTWTNRFRSDPDIVGAPLARLTTSPTSSSWSSPTASSSQPRGLNSGRSSSSSRTGTGRGGIVFEGVQQYRLRPWGVASRPRPRCARSSTVPLDERRRRTDVELDA